MYTGFPRPVENSRSPKRTRGAALFVPTAGLSPGIVDNLWPTWGDAVDSFRATNRKNLHVQTAGPGPA
ncbi:hypothetical protein STH3268 [Symbiobacterium thermophilum IAM 14863]|uniref:Uncharacterized protein n=1 Tax=Symbiobacterium thermophilum (strain DSM 24528 / JCM 14929 / IAM 14863 / T) TaxID=292459 RepID=Q67JA1_SYMTH|nr:hypothetical protein STH3268 [Symbiobacterium thermophilum IAM 14863]